MPRHQSFHISLKLKKKSEFDEQKSIKTQAFWGVYL